MARKSRKKSEGPKGGNLRSIDDSRFWQRLKTFDADRDFHGDRTAVETLRGNVRQVVEHSRFILTQITRHLPQYTLHDETHILNVLGLMEALTPDPVMDGLGPLECALCILAAYTHDLGMALRDEEYRAITDEAGTSPERQRFLRFRDRFGEEVRQIDRLHKSGDPGDRQRAEHIEAHILADFIRATHAEGDAFRGRVTGWLEAMKAPDVANNASLFTYGGIDYQQWLVLIGVSHNQDVEWLRKKLVSPGKATDFVVDVGPGESANLGFPGLLLRLADIMDFDASRTPRILFRHIGIDNKISLQEWNKHRAITRRNLDTDADEPNLTYSSAQCPHPVIEKGIRDFVSKIDAEVRSVSEEHRHQSRLLGEKGLQYRIHLPREVRHDIKPVGWPANPIYTYRDLQFRLDQDEIQQLLMGESLYGEPGLCIRELLQNALDALELRELRLKVVEKGGRPHEPVDPLRVVDGRREELRVTLTWGHDPQSGQDFLRVTDNGVGMTEKVITKYFTQIGKSYYRSPEYHQEQAALKAEKLMSSPISIFGIGILSCFMIADRLEVRTRPGGVKDDDTDPGHRDITISGPGSLFWLHRGTLEHQGTEITLYLKHRFRLKHDTKAFESGLRAHFGYPNGRPYKPGAGVIDPPFIAACHVVWPRHPIDLDIPGGKAIRIYERFHLDILTKIDRGVVIAKAAGWDCPASFIGEPEWGVWDWEDTEATGSRIRLAFPHNHGSPDCPDLPANAPEGRGLCRQDELASFVEPQLENSARTGMLMRGMFVQNSRVAFERLGVAPSVGSRVWIDLRGDAAPRLTADRKTMLAPENEGVWIAAIDGLFRRASQAMGLALKGRSPSVWSNVAYAFLWSDDPTPPPNLKCIQKFEINETINLSITPTDNFDNLLFSFCKLFQSIARDLDLYRALGHDRALILDRDLHLAIDLTRDGSRDQELDLARVLARDLDLALDRDPTFDHDLGHVIDLARDRDLPLALALALDLAFGHDDDFDFDLDLSLNRALDRNLHLEGARSRARARSLRSPILDECLYSSLLQEGFGPELSSSWPLFGCHSLSGHIAYAILTGPGLVEFEVEEDGRTLRFADPEGKRPGPLVGRGYDLTFPMPSIPLGTLRRDCASWRTDRRYPPLGVLPFLFPGLDSLWPKHAMFLRETFQISRIFALLPRLDLWDKRFADWTEVDWSTCGLSALWDLDKGCVLWAHGAHNVADMAAKGLPASEFFGKATHRRRGQRDVERGRGSHGPASDEQ